jgi:hypothetical protein
VDARDRQLLAGLAKVNTSIGRVTVELLTLQSDDAGYATGLRTLGRQLVDIGAELTARADELDGGLLDAADRNSAPAIEPGES